MKIKHFLLCKLHIQMPQKIEWMRAKAIDWAICLNTHKNKVVVVNNSCGDYALQRHPHLPLASPSCPTHTLLVYF